MAKVDALILRKIRQFLVRLAEDGIRVQATYLFGSYARGVENKWSDIDVAVISSDFTDNRFAERVHLMKLSASIDSRIEPVPFSPDNFIDDNPLAWEVKKDGIPI